MNVPTYVFFFIIDISVCHLAPFLKTPINLDLLELIALEFCRILFLACTTRLPVSLTCDNVLFSLFSWVFKYVRVGLTVEYADESTLESVTELGVCSLVLIYRCKVNQCYSFIDLNHLKEIDVYFR